MYRYRSNHASRVVMDRARKHLYKLGRLLSVRGYRYKGKYCGTNEAVMVVGEKGSARFWGVSWGYGGEGPHAVRDLLRFLGIARITAENVAFRCFRGDDVGVEWELPLKGQVAPPVQVQKAVYRILDVECDWCGTEIKAGKPVYRAVKYVEGHGGVLHQYCRGNCVLRSLNHRVPEAQHVSIEVK